MLCLWMNTFKNATKPDWKLYLFVYFERNSEVQVLKILFSLGRANCESWHRQNTTFEKSVEQHQNRVSAVYRWLAERVCVQKILNFRNVKWSIIWIIAILDGSIVRNWLSAGHGPKKKLRKWKYWPRAFQRTRGEVLTLNTRGERVLQRCKQNPSAITNRDPCTPSDLRIWVEFQISTHVLGLLRNVQ